MTSSQAGPVLSLPEVFDPPSLKSFSGPTASSADKSIGRISLAAIRAKVDETGDTMGAIERHHHSIEFRAQTLVFDPLSSDKCCCLIASLMKFGSRRVRYTLKMRTHMPRQADAKVSRTLGISMLHVEPLSASSMTSSQKRAPELHETSQACCNLFSEQISQLVKLNLKEQSLCYRLRLT